jgi:heat shock protein HtpX
MLFAYRLKTALLLGALSGLLLLLGRIAGGPAGLIVALVIAGIMNLIAYFFSDKIVLRLYQAQPLVRQHHEGIYQIVAELAQRMNIPQPKLWLIQSDMANAFATGRNPQHASVAVTTGILRLLDEAELRGVLAHELAHVKNRDILVSTLAATLATAIGYAADFMLRLSFYHGHGAREEDREKKRSSFLTTLVISLLLPFAAMLIQLAISRSREYLADETGAEVSGTPLALASALRKLEQNVAHNHFSSDDTIHTGTAPLFIVNPFLAGGIARLFSTHPPLKARIERLQALAHKFSGKY